MFTLYYKIENRINTYFKVALLTGSIISIILVVMTIIVLVKFDRIVWLGDIDKSLIGTIGDFIGGVIGTIFTVIATFLIWITYQSQKVELAETRKLVEQQLNANYHPHFAIRKDSQNFTESGKIEFADHTYGNGGSFVLELINIGNEPAKEVTISWDYFDSINRVLPIISTLEKANTSEANRHLSNLEYLESYRNNNAKYYYPVVEAYDFILPITKSDSKDGKVNIYIPYKMAIIFYEISKYYNELGTVKEPLVNLGYVHLSYRNSLNTYLKQEFRLICSFEETFIQELRQTLHISAIEIDTRFGLTVR